MSQIENLGFNWKKKIKVIRLVLGLPRKVVTLCPFVLSLWPWKGDYLDPGLSMKTGVKTRSPLFGSPSNAVFCEKDNFNLVL